MRSSQLFFSLISLLLGFFLFGIGIFLFFMPHMPQAMGAFQLLVIDHPQSLSKLGIALMMFSASILLIYGILTRRRYILIHMGGKVMIHEKVIKELAKRSLIELFPDHRIGCDVIIHRKGRVEILADIPKAFEENQEIMEKIENALNSSLVACGIDKEFLLNVHFS